ncbi:MAG TPA: hypothetical protein VNJ01_08000 [Bacteriovoracaceae bacterium]|nr:hypothetical protein [Bacteriovoracaceae bacterium]
MNTYFHKLSNEQLATLKDSENLENLSGDFEIIGKDNKTSGTVPILVEGEILIMKNDEAFLVVTPGYIIGLNPLLKGKRFKLKCRAKNAKAFFAKIDDLLHPKDGNILSSILEGSY